MSNKSKTRKYHYRRPSITSYQRAILDSPARYTVCEASTKVGKTASHIIWMFEQALQGKANQNFWWVAPVYGQAEIAFERMRNQISDPNFFKVNISKLRLTLPNGTHIWFKSADKPNSLYGEDVYAVVFDEFTRAKEEAWIALRSTVTATKAKVKFIGNCRGKKGWYAQLTQKAKIYTKQNPNVENPHYEYFKITAYDAVDAGILDLEEIELAKQDLTEDVFRELYLAEASDDGGNPFGLKYIEACVVPSLSTKPPVCYGIDLASSVDFTVVIGLDEDGNVCYFDRWQAPWGETIKKLKKLEDIPMLIDSTGVGAPILDQIQDDYLSAEGFIFSSRSKQQLMEGLAVDIQQRATTFDDGILRDELDAFEYEYTRTGVRYSTPVGFNDDAVCAFALARRKFNGLSRVEKFYEMPILG